MKSPAGLSSRSPPIMKITLSATKPIRARAQYFMIRKEFTVACGEGAVRAIEAQRAGKSPMSGAELMRGGAIGILESALTELGFACHRMRLQAPGSEAVT